MKRFNRSIAGKIINYILCLVCFTALALSIVGIGLMVNYGIYDTPKADAKKSAFLDMFNQEANSIAYYFLHDEDVRLGYAYTEFEYENTNLRFWIEDADGNLVGHNLNGEEIAYQELDYMFSCPFQIIEEIESTDEADGHGAYIDCWSEVEPGTENAYTIYGYVYEINTEITDGYMISNRLIDLAYSYKMVIILIALISGLLSLIFFVLLMCSAGKRTTDDEIHPGILNMVPTDVLLAVVICGYLLVVTLVDEGFMIEELTWAVAIVLGANMLLSLAMSIANRLKLKTLFTNSLVFMLLKLLWKGLRALGRFIKNSWKLTAEVYHNLNAIWRWVLIILGITIIEFFVVLFNLYEGDTILLFWVAEKIILLPIALYAVLSLYKLKKAGEALAKGDLDYKTDTDKMLWDLKRHGENLNSIGQGMLIAVEERLQSERMKTELITNVSHDIKTPLTSIINYARLIGDEPCNSEKHLEYAEVLVRKSEQLKRLLEDLVEISKANSGNLEVNVEKCEAGVLLTQAAGEFEHRCKERNLELITTQPETQIHIMADSRRIWRVFENLMNNACKYSLPNSRVYMSLTEENGDAVFTFRNTSATALNITPKELMERFVRGEQSRTTEGNGLGLSIASSLVEIQNGKMDIVIDGDLFKVIIRFPIV